MKSSVCKCLLFFLFGFILYQSTSSAESKMTKDFHDFDSHAKAFEGKGALLLSEGLQHIAQYDQLPASDGVFGDHVRMLCALPHRKEHLPLIIKLIQKSDPHLQEAGVKLASSSVNALNDYSGLEAPIVALLKKPELDPWVLRAIVQFASTSNNRISPDLTNLYEVLAIVAYKRQTPKLEEPRIWRNMAIFPSNDAKDLLDQVMLNATSPTPRSKAILPYLEDAYGTKGWQETYYAVRKKVLGEN